MNLRRGLFRVWLVVSVIWLAWWGTYLWNSRLEATEDKTGRQFVAFHTDFGVPWREVRDFGFVDYLSVLAIGFGIPLLVLAVGCGLTWAAAGFSARQIRRLSPT